MDREPLAPNTAPAKDTYEDTALTNASDLFLHAYCLDEAKQVPGHEEIWIGPFHECQITYNYLQAYAFGPNGHELRYVDWEPFQFVHRETGFWYPLAHVQHPTMPGASSSRPDPARGRFTDLYIITRQQLRSQDHPFLTGIHQAARRYPATAEERLEAEWAEELRATQSL
jgi:hypothetical protein